MKHVIPPVLLVLVALGVSPATAPAQPDEGPQIFGYFQIQYASDRNIESQEQRTSFSVQQLNIFFRQKIGTRWTSFVNFESVNSYNSEHGWGSFSLEEAWVKYHGRRWLNVKMGLLIPRFNRLNEIKNRMPVLPYIIRPLAYESSLAEVVAVEEYVPRRAYVQVDGTHRIREVKAEFAFYTGNSVHVPGGDSPDTVTGTDTTGHFMAGGRIGLRHKDTSVGFSFTGEKIDLIDFFPAMADSFDVEPSELDDITRTRIGVDLYTRFRRVSLEAEHTRVEYHEDVDALSIDKEFSYATLGYDITDKWFAYVSYWKTVEDHWITPFGVGGERTFTIRGFGATYALNERIKFKGQFGKGEYEADIADLSEFDFDYTALAVTVFF